MKLFLIGTILSAGVIVVLLMARMQGNVQSFDSAEPLSSTFSSKKILSGDIVFRLGHGYISETLKNISQKDKRFSHAGVISIENGIPYVYHLIGSESDMTTLRREALVDFCKPASAQSYALYHISLNDSQRQAVDTLNQYYYHCALPFDSRFDMGTDSAMYCTEYVYKILTRASRGNFLVTSSELSGFRFIGCDDIYLNSKCKRIFEYSYKNN